MPPDFPCDTDPTAHRWIPSDAYRCRRCWHQEVRYDLHDEDKRVIRMVHPDGNPGAFFPFCRGKLVRLLMCAYCGVFKPILSK
jgi:hypothetical protein